jgi:hypothetical protein
MDESPAALLSGSHVVRGTLKVAPCHMNHDVIDVNCFACCRGKGRIWAVYHIFAIRYRCTKLIRCAIHIYLE